MKRTSVVASTLVFAQLVVVGPGAWQAAAVSAQQSTANMLVVTAVTKKCNIVTSQLDFGSYDPVGANATTPLDGQTVMTVACTKGTTLTIGIDAGSNAAGQARRMVSGPNLLNYELYQDQNRTLRWGDVAGQTFNGGVAPSRDPRPFTVYGRVAGMQDVPQGDYTDTVLVTVQF